MAARCLLCGAKGAACGQPTAARVIPIDATVRGYTVAGDKLVPDSAEIAAVVGDGMTTEEREEFVVMQEAYERRRNRLKVGMEAMADGRAPHTSLSYVQQANGVVIKMHPDVARKYVEMNEGSEIVREGARPVAKEGEIIGATKARLGEMFDENGRQREDVQPLTSRTFLASDRVRDEAITPAVGTVGAANSDANTGTGNLTTSATSTAPKIDPPHTKPTA